MQKSKTDLFNRYFATCPPLIAAFATQSSAGLTSRAFHPDLSGSISLFLVSFSSRSVSEGFLEAEGAPFNGLHLAYYPSGTTEKKGTWVASLK